MPSPTLNKDQAKKQVAATKERFRKKAEEGVPVLRSPLIPRTMKQMNDKVEQMLPSALDIIEKVLEGDETTSKTQGDMAKYVVNLASANAKAQLDYKAQTLKYKVDMTKAINDGLVSDKDKQQEAKNFGSPVLVDENFSMDFEEEDDM